MSNQITGEQIKAARALLRLKQADLSAASGVSVRTLKKIEGVAEGGVDAVTPVYASAAVRALEDAGAVFGPGVSVGLREAR